MCGYVNEKQCVGVQMSGMCSCVIGMMRWYSCQYRFVGEEINYTILQQSSNHRAISNLVV